MTRPYLIKGYIELAGHPAGWPMVALDLVKDRGRVVGLYLRVKERYVVLSWFAA